MNSSVRPDDRINLGTIFQSISNSAFIYNFTIIKLDHLPAFVVFTSRYLGRYLHRYMY
jgi:hypothetical protein